MSLYTESNQEQEDNRLKIAELRSAACVVAIPEGSDGNRGDDGVHGPAVGPQSEGASGCTSEKPRETPRSTESSSGEACARTVQVPKLKFTSPKKPDGIVINESGSDVTMIMDGPGLWTWVRTDGRLTGGLLYWEVEVTWGPLSRPDGLYWIGTVGVRPEGSDYCNSRSPCRDIKLLAVVIDYNFHTNNIKCRFNRSKITCYESNPVTCEKNSVTLGFLLDAPDRTLTVVDVSRDTRLFTFTKVDMSRPLVPEVESMNYFSHRTFRLLSVNPSGLPKSVRVLLET